MEHVRTFVFHAERLEEDPVWERTLRVLTHLETRNGRGTVFVHPLSAIELNIDIRPRIAELLERGHEVGQHTHFYAERVDGHVGKLGNDFSSENVRRCLDRDLAYLREAGAQPKGFTSGGWAIHSEAAHWLEEQDFTYDCSYRSFDLRYVSAPAIAGSSRRPEHVGGLLRLPTTIPLRDAALAVITRKRMPLSIGSVSYELVYVHDYDLIVALRSRTSHVVISSWSRRKGRWATALDLAGLIGSLDG